MGVVDKRTLIELRDAWGFTLMQLRHVMELQHISSVDYDPIYLALQGRLMTKKQAEQLLRGIYLLTGTQYHLEDIDIQVKQLGD